MRSVEFQALDRELVAIPEVPLEVGVRAGSERNFWERKSLSLKRCQTGPCGLFQQHGDPGALSSLPIGCWEDQPVAGIQGDVAQGKWVSR